MNDKCDCTTFYFLDGTPKCLHKLFRTGQVRILVREKTREGVKFYIYIDKPKDKSQAWKRGWWKNGARARLTDRDQILLAIELSEKYKNNVRRVRL